MEISHRCKKRNSSFLEVLNVLGISDWCPTTMGPDAIESTGAVSLKIKAGLMNNNAAPPHLQTIAANSAMHQLATHPCSDYRVLFVVRMCNY